MTEPPTAVVTGAGSGIGRAVARALLADGWSVALAGRRRAALEQTADGHEHALVVPTDVTDPASVTELFATVQRTWGRLDLLVNNAGVFAAPATVDELDVETWTTTIAVNLTGAFLCARAAFGLMRNQDPPGGRIVNNGSISAHTPRPLSAPYTASKHAITGLTKSLSLDGRPFGIACGQIDIGNAATELTASLDEPTFDVAHVADAVRFMAGLPLDANVQFLTIAATTMPYIGRG